MTQITNNNKLDKNGINALQTLVEEQGSIFRRIHLENDIGHDAYIEFCIDGKPNGVEIKVQVKSGESYFNKLSAFIKGDKEHFEYWRNHIPVTIGVVYNPITKVLYWTNISEYLSNNKKTLSYNIPCNNILNNETFGVFLEECSLYCRNDKNRISIEDKINALYSDDIDLARSALKSLFLTERNTQLFWNTIIAFISVCYHKEILDGVAYYLSIAIGEQGDVYWYEENVIDSNIRIWLTEKFNKVVNEQMLYKILSVINKDDSIDRVTIGNLVIIFIKKIQNRSEFLLDIFKNKDYEFHIRDIALMYYLSELNSKEALNWLQQNLNWINNEQLPFNLNITIYYEFKKEFEIYKEIIEKYGAIFLY